MWLGTSKIFDLFTFAFVHTDAGWIWCHAYAFDAFTSTFIVECPPETWTGLGFDTLNAADTIAQLEKIFADQLGGAPLEHLGRDDSVGWLNFRTLTNERWHSNNIVLMGDAAPYHALLDRVRDAARAARRDRAGRGTPSPAHAETRVHCLRSQTAQRALAAAGRGSLQRRLVRERRSLRRSLES